jgi:hypothetical protein
MCSAQLSIGTLPDGKSRGALNAVIMGEYLNPLAEAADGSESDSLGLVQSRSDEAETATADVTTRARSGGIK